MTSYKPELSVDTDIFMYIGFYLVEQTLFDIEKVYIMANLHVSSKWRHLHWYTMTDIVVPLPCQSWDIVCKMNNFEF